MKSCNKLVEVLLPLALPKLLAYKSPIEAQIGSFVEVPLGTKLRKGVVWGVCEDKIEESKLKSVTKVFDLPPLSREMIKFIDWVASYTLSPKGNVLKMVMPQSKLFEKEKKLKAYIWNNDPDKPTQKRKKILDLLKESKNPQTKEQILEKTSASVSILNSLVKSEAVKEIYIDEPRRIIKSEDFSKLIFSKEQQIVVNSLRENLQKDSFKVSLIDGVTGSGKTEVYFSSIEEILKQNTGQVLVLLPEIALTSQFIARFEGHFRFKPSSWHSNITPVQKKKIWNNIQKGNERLVVGARSSLFLPFKDLKLIVIDEEHDSSYKQEDGVIYNARDMAIVRAKIENIPVILSSATPSLETICNVKEGKYERLHINYRHGGALLPDIKIINMKKENLTRSKWLSPSLLAKLDDNIKNNNQSLIFLNRRGYAPYIFCKDCGYKYHCETCSSWMTEHNNPHRLLCHHCSKVKEFPKSCHECGSENVISFGAGVERIKNEINKFFPTASIELMTSDDINSSSNLEDKIQRISSGEVDIIIGTQVIAKGHHFPKLTLVGVIDSDLGLFGGDLRAGEKTYQLLHQVAGRAGRESKKGTVMLQTFFASNKIIEALCEGRRDDYYDFELENRRSINMPPFSKFVSLILSSKDELYLNSYVNQVKKIFPSNDNIQVLGPSPAPIFLLRGNYRYRFLIKTDKNINIQKWLKSFSSNIKIPNNIKMKIDVDPYNFM